MRGFETPFDDILVYRLANYDLRLLFVVGPEECIYALVTSIGIMALFTALEARNF